MSDLKRVTIFQRMDEWVDSRKHFWMDFLRILFGGFLLWKGIEFGKEINDIPVIIGRYDFMFIFILVYIVIFQIAAGIVIMFGLITRVAILCVLPILIGAVIYTPRATKLPPLTNEPIAVISLLIALVFLFYGSGRYSSDSWYRRHTRSGTGR